MAEELLKKIIVRPCVEWTGLVLGRDMVAPPTRVVKRWDVNTVLSVNTNNRTTLDFLNNNKLNVWDFH